MQIRRRSLLLSIAVLLPTAALLAQDRKEAAPPATQSSSGAVSLFDGKGLGHWKATEFGGQGEVEVKGGELILNHGDSLTGVTWQGKPPTMMNYQIDLDARRVDGNDFFCGLTFPVNDDCASLIIGGWGGGLCGISCLDGLDAANNNTTTVREFQNGKWYHIRLRVTADHLAAWIDDKQIVDVETKGKKISVRHEVDASQPLGIASYQSTAAIKNITLRKLGGRDK